MERCSCPKDIRKLEEKVEKVVKEIYGKDGIFVHCGPKNYLVAKGFANQYDELHNFEIRKDDAWLFGFPRSGTTLTQEMLWLIGNDLDYEGAAKTVLDIRFPVLESNTIFNPQDVVKSANIRNANKEVKEIVKQYIPLIENLKKFKGKRFIKTHLPFSLLPHVLESGCKVVYCARNPKDIIVSSYHLYDFFNVEMSVHQDFPTFCKLFKENLVGFTPYLEHVKEGWNHRNDKNFLFLFYEDTVKNKREALLKVAKFLNKTLTDSDLDKLEDHLTIDNFRKNKSVNNDHLVEIGIARETKENQFIRKGKVGGWRNYFTKELNDEIDQWIEESLKGSDLVFP